MKSKRLSQIGYGALVCAVAVSGLPRPTGHKVDRFRPTHSIPAGDFTKTITVTVSLGPSTSVTLGAPSPPVSCTDEDIPTAASSFTSASPTLPSVVISTVVLTTEIATTLFPSVTSLVSVSFSSESSESILPTASTSLSSPPVPTLTDTSFNPITAPATGGGNPVLAQNAADAQELNRYFRTLTFRDSCVNNDQACVGDGRAVCALGKWRQVPCTHPNTRCRAVPRMQTNGTGRWWANYEEVLGCYTDADVQARISSTGQPGNAFGE